MLARPAIVGPWDHGTVTPAAGDAAEAIEEGIIDEGGGMRDVHSRIDGKGRITIPKEIRRELDLETGDTLMLRVTQGRIEAVPMTLVPREQSWFYEEVTQERLAEAQDDLLEGRTRRVASRGELERALDGEGRSGRDVRPPPREESR